VVAVATRLRIRKKLRSPSLTAMSEPNKTLIVEHVICGGITAVRWRLKASMWTSRAASHCLLIGPSGCGKSTLLRCSTRMNDLIDGVRIEGSIEIAGSGRQQQGSGRDRICASASAWCSRRAMAVPEDGL